MLPMPAPFAHGSESRQRTAILPQGLWMWTQSHHSRVLVLDFDTVIAPFVTNRMPLRLTGGFVQALTRLSCTGRGRLVITSGRPLSELRALRKHARTHIIAEHGWEEMRADGWKVRHPLPAVTERTLQRAKRAAEEFGWGRHLRKRRCSVALDVSMLSTEDSAMLSRLCTEVWSQGFETNGLIVCNGPSGPEIRASGRSTWVAVRELARGCPEAPAVVYVEIVSEKGAGGWHASTHPECDAERPGAIRVVIHHPHELLDVLREWPSGQQAAAT
jgi:hypothetical protein